MTGRVRNRGVFTMTSCSTLGRVAFAYTEFCGSPIARRTRTTPTRLRQMKQSSSCAQTTKEEEENERAGPSSLAQPGACGRTSSDAVWCLDVRSVPQAACHPARSPVMAKPAAVIGNKRGGCSRVLVASLGCARERNLTSVRVTNHTDKTRRNARVNTVCTCSRTSAR